jgi:transglutaminase-like putative cysteine protease
MHFNPREVAGSRVRFRYSAELTYEATGPAHFLLNVHAARTPRQRVFEESFETTPGVAFTLDEDPATGNRIAAFDVPSGKIVVRYAARVEVSHRIVEPADVIAESPSKLSVESLPFLYPSRYCQSDLVQQEAWDTFGSMPRGYGQVRAVRDWVQRRLRFQVGTSRTSTTAIDTLRDGAGACRDFAHTMIAYCRALNYPTRFVSGIDYGADPALGPTDFHAYVEAFVGGGWYLFDPTGISPITGLLRIGTGRDAAEVSFATIFGPVRTGAPRIEIETFDDPANGFTSPIHTELAVSTAE